jgi:hypothetical protein
VTEFGVQIAEDGVDLGVSTSVPEHLQGGGLVGRGLGHHVLSWGVR